MMYPTPKSVRLRILTKTMEHISAGPVYPLCQGCGVPGIAEWDEREERWLCNRCQERPHRLRDLERLLTSADSSPAP